MLIRHDVCMMAPEGERGDSFLQVDHWPPGKLKTNELPQKVNQLLGLKCNRVLNVVHSWRASRLITYTLLILANTHRTNVRFCRIWAGAEVQLQDQKSPDTTRTRNYQNRDYHWLFLSVDPFWMKVREPMIDALVLNPSLVVLVSSGTPRTTRIISEIDVLFNVGLEPPGSHSWVT